MTNTSTQILYERILSVTGNHAEMTQLYPGIDLITYTCSTPALELPVIDCDDLIITVCRRGHLKWQYSGENRVLLGQGDFCIHAIPSVPAKIEFIDSSFEGFMLTLCNSADDILSSVLEGSNITKEGISHRFSPCTMIHGNEYTDRIFSFFYDQPDSLQNSYRRLKTMEFLLHIQRELSSVQNMTENQSEQIEIVRNVHEYLLQNIDTHITIDMLAHKFLMNPTTLKQLFKEVYGDSLAAHIKEHRMEEAARLLKETDLTLAQVAKAVGYDSQSKFTAAFKNWYHELPSNFRKHL